MSLTTPTGKRVPRNPPTVATNRPTGEKLRCRPEPLQQFSEDLPPPLRALQKQRFQIHRRFNVSDSFLSRMSKTNICEISENGAYASPPLPRALPGESCARPD